jgi:dihydrodipicolinate synthase/N-acetylneuraminate lyase
MKKPSIFDISAMRKEMFKLAKEGRRDEAQRIHKQIQELTQTDTSDPTYYQKKKGKRRK